MPADIRKLANTILVNPKTVQVANTVAVASVGHAFYTTQNHLKIGLLGKLLDTTEHQSVLIFTRTKHKAKNLSRKLSNDGYNCTFLQGNMSQSQRQKALDGFRQGQIHHHGGHGYCGARHRLRLHFPCHQLRHAGHGGDLHPPHRAHR